MAPTSYTVLSLGYSDGVASTHPTNNTKPLPNSDGTWDYFRPVDNEEAKSILWRSKSAAALVEKYTPPEKQQPGRNYIFKTLPDGYKLFEHIKGKKGGPDRKDTYLFGHPNGSRFRSPAEFIPHIYHLASKAPEHAGTAAEENKSCQCKYCGIATTKTPSTSTRKPAVPRRIPDHVLAHREICAEERLGEQEMTGYVMRKGEIVWVWTGAEDELDDVVEIQDSEQWAAAMVVEKPSTNPPFRKPEKPKGSFEDIEMDDGFSAPWQDSKKQGKDRTYAVQLCTDTTTPGVKFTNMPQYFLRPWLARPNAIAPPASYSGKKEHSTVQPARDIIATLYSGLFLGPEKIFVGDPVRISDPNGTFNEDVLVVEHIYTISPVPTAGTPAASSTVSVHVTGSVYHISKNRPITPEQFAQLPWRMRRTDPKTGNIISWSVRNSPSQRGELSIKLVLGRWYEPEAIEYWMFPDEQPKLGTKNVVKWVKDRAHALGWTSVNGVKLIKAEDQRKPENSILASNVMDVDRVTPERGFKSVNTPGSAGKSRMARAVEGDDDEIEEDDDVVDEPAKTPNRRLSFRPRDGG
ncbi:hypothetical protein BDD12DRAFT_815983 [Trichophaea hybrida]|nr:hypothetical protein BDD12DRAFT_815983 [Trichophaea hybrida]